MDARPALSLIRGITGLMVLTAWSSPHLVEHSDFRASLRIKPIVSNRASPALAALEDTRLAFGGDDLHPALLAETLKTGKNFAWNKKPNLKLSLPATVISQNTKVDHLRELV